MIQLNMYSPSTSFISDRHTELAQQLLRAGPPRKTLEPLAFGKRPYRGTSIIRNACRSPRAS